jgi:hypothetical protein
MLHAEVCEAGQFRRLRRLIEPGRTSFEASPSTFRLPCPLGPVTRPLTHLRGISSCNRRCSSPWNVRVECARGKPRPYRVYGKKRPVLVPSHPLVAFTSIHIYVILLLCCWAGDAHTLSRRKRVDPRNEPRRIKLKTGGNAARGARWRGARWRGARWRGATWC